jgi:hypothetical protein
MKTVRFMQFRVNNETDESHRYPLWILPWERTFVPCIIMIVIREAMK